MGLIQLKAKVFLMSESDMENERLELGIPPQNAKWVYRMITMRTEDIITIIKYTSTKTIIETVFEKVLIDEPYASVHKKWVDEYEEDLVLDLDESKEGEINEDDGKDSEDDDD